MNPTDAAINLPLSPLKKIDLHHNMALNKNTSMRIERATINPYAISASENAFIEEADAKERGVHEQDRIEAFHSRIR